MNKREYWMFIASCVLGLILGLLSGCTTLPPIQAVNDTTKILQGDILKPDHMVTAAEKKLLIETLTEDRRAILIEQVKEEKAEAQSASNAVWARRGKEAAIFAGIACLLLIAGIVLRVLKFFGVIP